MSTPRGLRPLRLEVPRGGLWTKMSDHLPLIAEFELPPLAPLASITPIALPVQLVQAAAQASTATPTGLLQAS